MSVEESADTVISSGSRHLVLFQKRRRFLDFARNDKWSVPRMLRVSSETVKTLAVCWKKSAVSCIRKTVKASKR